ncbi:MAG: hypothetical protein DRN90_03595 [Thermoproteota archaeon]|nr:MAG: hypothetical protein DRN90_03595 [Candidatus Korarchaeota archaeon]
MVRSNSTSGRNAKGSERLLQTAIRETREETGISLSINEVLGTLEPTYPKNAPGIEVIPFIFFLSKEMELRPGDEIEFCRWIPLAKILSNAAEIKLPGKGRVSAFIFENMVIWGMTHGILLDLWRFLEELGLN